MLEMLRKGLAYAGLLAAGCVAAVALALYSLAAAAGDCTVSAVDLAQSSDERRVLDLVNEYRAQNGLGALAWNETASRAATWKSNNMAATNTFSHTDPDGRTFDGRMRDCGVSGYPNVGENIAAGYPSPEAVMAAWKNSPGHNQNMLRGWRSMAVGVTRGGSYGIYYTQVFSGADGTVPVTPTPTPTPSPTPTPTCFILVMQGGQQRWVSKPTSWCEVQT